MGNDLVSIIVPVYNCAPYLEQCISSVLAQTYRNIEVILVDDGSTDGSGDICRRYASLDKRVKLISQHNQGVVIARKNGAKLAGGRYIGFVDADDYIDVDLYEKLMSCAGDFDLVISRWFREENGETRQCFDKITVGAYQTEEDMNFLLDHLVNVSSVGGGITIKSGFVAYMFVKLYKATMAREVFDEVDETITISEDVDFTYRYFLKCTSVLITDICGYHYRIREGSACHGTGFRRDYFENMCKLYESVLPVFQAHPRHDKLVPQLQFKISTMLNKAPSKMGFPANAQNRPITFPFLNLLDDKRVVLYGAGDLGQIYYRQILRFSICDVVL